MELTELHRFLLTNWYTQNKTDADLAKILEVDHTLICKWKLGIKVPLYRKIQIAQKMGLDSREIFADDEDAEEVKNVSLPI